MTNSVADAPLVSSDRLAGMNRRRRDMGALSQSILGEYYWNREGWVSFAEGHETAQGQRLIDKGWKPIPRSPRVTVETEHARRFHALLRTSSGPLHFPVAQIVEYGWSDITRCPVVMTCREKLDDFDHTEHTQECFARVEFPQLGDVSIYEMGCSLCRRKFQTEKSHAEVERQVKAHMEVQHRDHLVNKELVTGLRDALAPVVGSGGMGADQIAQIAATAAIAAVQQFMSVSPNPEPVGEEGIPKKK